MGLKEGQIIREWDREGHHLICRFLKGTDVKGLMDYINSLVREQSRINLVQPVTLKEEKTYVRSLLSKMKKGKLIHVVVEADGEIAGAAELSCGGDLATSSDHCATFGIGLKKSVRGLGLGMMLAQLVCDLAQKQWSHLRIIKSAYYSDNLASARLHKRLGFAVYGVLKKGGKFGDAYVDEILAAKHVRD